MHYKIINNGSVKALVQTMSNEEIEKDILKMKKFGFNVMAFPYGIFTEEIKKLLEKNGYLISFRFGPQKFATRQSDRFAINRIKLNGNANLGTLKKWLKF